MIKNSFHLFTRPKEDVYKRQVQMGLYKSAVSRLIDHLEKKGFLKKHYCETDKRSYVLLTTETGNMELDCTYRYYLEPIYKLREVLGAESFESLTTQIQTANELLQDVYKRQEKW